MSKATSAALGCILAIATVTIASGTAGADVPPTASCLGYGSSATGPLHLRSIIATHPETIPPGAGTGQTARQHGDSYDVCFSS